MNMHISTWAPCLTNAQKCRLPSAPTKVLKSWSGNAAKAELWSSKWRSLLARLWSLVKRVPSALPATSSQRAGHASFESWRADDSTQRLQTLRIPLCSIRMPVSWPSARSEMICHYSILLLFVYYSISIYTIITVYYNYTCSAIGALCRVIRWMPTIKQMIRVRWLSDGECI